MRRTRFPLALLAAALASSAYSAKPVKPAPPRLTAAGPVSCNLAADYRIGPTDLRNDYGWCVQYTTVPHLADQRRAPGGGVFVVGVDQPGAKRSAIGPRNITILATWPNALSIRYQLYPGIRQDVDFLVLSSSVTAQRVTLRNTGKRPARLQVTAVEGVRDAGTLARRYAHVGDAVRAIRNGNRTQVATLFLSGATSWGAFDGAFDMPASGPLPRTLPRVTAPIVPSASFTYPGDSVMNPLDDSPLHGDARWTAYDSHHDSDWYAVDFGAPRPVRAVTLDLYVDREGCWAPTAIDIQRWEDGGWKDITTAGPDTIPAAGGPMTISFPEVTAPKLRAVFHWQGNGHYGGIRHFRTDPPLPAANIHADSMVALRREVTLAPGQSVTLLSTVVTSPSETGAAPVTPTQFADAMQRIAKVNAAAKKLEIADPATNHLIHEQIDLVAQTIFRPQGQFKTPWFAFARGGMRHPGWSEDHQHAHEGLAYIPLAISDPSGLRGILRSFFSQQQPDGRVPYGTSMVGPSGDIATFPSLSLLTWRLYKATNDRSVLEEFLPKLERFNAWWYANRFEKDPGLFWWGSFESTRDGSNPEDLRGPKLGIRGGHHDMVNPDLTALLYMDNRMIARMAGVLGRTGEAKRYAKQAGDLKAALEFLWDEQAANYQYRARKSLYPDERWVKIVDYGSLLPLWAEMVDPARARRIIRTHLLNPAEMWRVNGIPSLSAAEPEYTPKAWSSNWNGQLWVQWTTLFVDALLHYGFTKEADELARRVAAMQAAMLQRDKHFYEDYSADNLVHENAIYDYTWGGGNIQSFWDIHAARQNGGRFSLYE